MTTKNDIDLSGLEGFEMPEEIPADSFDKDIYEKSLGLVQEAMKTVIQEMIVIDKQGEHHIAYITHLAYEDGKITFDFNTPSEKKDIVEKLVQECLEVQIKEASNQRPNKSFWKFLK